MIQICSTVLHTSISIALRLSDRREGAREIRLYQDEVYTTLINFSYYLPKSQEGIKSYDHF